MLITALFIILCVTAVITAIITIMHRDLLVCVIAFSVFGLIMTALFYLLEAPDVAIAEASIGAALTICIFVFAIRMTRRREE